uniref:Uncharacterized protein n=1 Tax=Noctiluca scintillans TaxID=2966 RepID=A0A7S1FCW2_NOCSC|mmetsp:Transcript_50863/g.135788  ORF Transcript_50863/g.135788 Transcript_50863/m.135788 type:complete len:141 (+) Transcript_50863:71-493(+)
MNCLGVVGAAVILLNIAVFVDGHFALNVIDCVVCGLGIILLQISDPVVGPCTSFPWLPLILVQFFALDLTNTMLSINDINKEGADSQVIVCGVVNTVLIGVFAFWWLCRYRSQEGHYGCPTRTKVPGETVVQLDEFGLDN